MYLLLCPESGFEILECAQFVSFLLANFVGVLWEISEFVADKLFRLNAQRGLDDTMFDLIFNIFGSYFAIRFAEKLFKERRV